jgi:hypothetical protein
MCFLRVFDRDISSERFVGIELGRLFIRHELLAPSLLHLRTIRVPQRLTQQLQALEDCQGLLGRPVPRYE